MLRLVWLMVPALAVGTGCSRQNGAFGDGATTSGSTSVATSSATKTSSETESSDPPGPSDSSDSPDPSDPSDSASASGMVTTDMPPATGTESTDTLRGTSETGDEGHDCCASAAAGINGCNDPVVEACVCDPLDGDPFCCDNTWDEACTLRAHYECAAECGFPTVCCEPSPYAGCGDADVDACVCAIPGGEDCCEGEWYPHCTVIAAAFCGEECALPGDCCEGGDDQFGCEDLDTLECVCDLNGETECCTSNWSVQCADLAAGLCKLECGRPKMPGDTGDPPEPKPG